MAYSIRGKRIRQIEVELDEMHRRERAAMRICSELDEAIDECARHGLRVVMMDGRFRVFGGRA